MSILSQNQESFGIKLWVAAKAKNFYACNMQVYTGKSGGVREKKQDLQVVTCMEPEEVLLLIISSQVVN